MLADKTLLSVTLAATFASGAFVGYAAHQPRNPAGAANDPNVVYAAYLSELDTKGYDAEEMTEARRIYADYHRSYEGWFNSFLDVHRANVELVEEKRVKSLDALEKKHKERTGAK